MSRYVRDPWARKSKQGMKTLDNMLKGAVAVGSAMYVHSKNKKNTPKPTPSVEAIPFSGLGCLVFIIGAIIAFIVMFSLEDLELGFYWLVFILGLTGIFSIIVSYASKSGNFNNKAEFGAMSEMIYSKDFSSTAKFNASSKEVISKELVEELSEKIINMSSLEDIESCVTNFNNCVDKKKLIIKSIDTALLQISNQTEVDGKFDGYLDSLALRYYISESELQKLSSYVEYVKLLIMQDILNGVVPKRVTLDGNPINMLANEIPIWVFPNVVYYEEVSSKSYIGASGGLSIRVCKGVYYRVGAFKGQPLITSSLKPKYGGDLIFTNKNIYFYSRGKSIRYPYSKILSYVPSEDAIGIQLDKANAKTVYMKNIDGRFAFNIVTNIGLVNNSIS